MDLESLVTAMLALMTYSDAEDCVKALTMAVARKASASRDAARSRAEHEQAEHEAFIAAELSRLVRLLGVM